MSQNDTLHLDSGHHWYILKIMKYIPGILFAKNDRIKEVLDRS
jgi:hypothetical protein